MINKNDLIAEVRRLAHESPSGAVTRDYFRKNSLFTEHAVKKEFGNFSELLRAAFLTEGRMTTAYDSRKAVLESEVRFGEYFQACMLPWARKESENTDEHVTMVIGSDFHGESVDRFALSVFLDTIERLQPAHVILNGDIVDFEPVNRWTKGPNKLHNIQEEIDFTVESILRPVRAAAPDAIIDLVTGNHEYNICRYLAEQAPGLASLRCLSFGELFKLSELEIGLVFGGNILAPAQADRRKQAAEAFKIYYNTFVVTHGTATGPGAAAAELSRFKISGCSGHLHKQSSAYSSSIDRSHLEWHVLPKMTYDSVGEVYMRGLPTEWHTGFAVVDIFPKEQVSFYQPSVVKKGVCMSAGVVYRDDSDQ